MVRGKGRDLAKKGAVFRLFHPSVTRICKETADRVTKGNYDPRAIVVITRQLNTKRLE